jgi:hypothetical protein
MQRYDHSACRIPQQDAGRRCPARGEDDVRDLKPTGVGGAQAHDEVLVDTRSGGVRPADAARRTPHDPQALVRFR